MANLDYQKAYGDTRTHHKHLPFKKFLECTLVERVPNHTKANT